jgi:hypothetical protein
MTMCYLTNSTCNGVCHRALSPKQIGAASIDHRVLFYLNVLVSVSVSGVDVGVNTDLNIILA